jgi:hypothetical protein
MKKVLIIFIVIIAFLSFSKTASAYVYDERCKSSYESSSCNTWCGYNEFYDVGDFINRSGVCLLQTVTQYTGLSGYKGDCDTTSCVYSTTGCGLMDCPDYGAWEGVNCYIRDGGTYPGGYPWPENCQTGWSCKTCGLKWDQDYRECVECDCTNHTKFKKWADKNGIYARRCDGSSCYYQQNHAIKWESDSKFYGYDAPSDTSIPTNNGACEGGCGADPGCDEKNPGETCIKDGKSGTCNNNCQCVTVVGCTIGGVSYNNGDYNPNNKCQICDVSKSTTSWSNVADGTDPAGWCSPSWNSCDLKCVRRGGDGNCYAGACDTNHRTGYITAGKVCSNGNEVDATSESLACDSNTDYFCTAGITTTLILRPNANGDVISQGIKDGTETNYKNVNEETADDDTSYNYTNNTTFQKDLFQLPDPAGGGTINYVKVYFRARGYGTLGGTEGYATIRTYGVDYDGTTQSIPTDYTTYSYQWTNNPNTNQPWTWTEINALQVGTVGRQISSLGKQYRCTQVYVEVNYTTGYCTGYKRYSECNAGGTCDTAATTNYHQIDVLASAGSTLTSTCGTTVTTLCDATWRASSGPGDNNYGAGGSYNCQGMCDGDPTDPTPCDYAVNCTSSDFSLSASPTSLKGPKASGTSDPQTTITVNSLNSFNSAVTLSARWCTDTADASCVQSTPAGLTPSFSATPITPPANGSISSTLSIDTNNPATGNYYFRARGVSGSLTHDTSVITLTIVDLSVTLSANPSSGATPLNGVDLTATVSGTATGTINYKFDCTSDGTWDYTFNNISDNPKIVVDACNYASAGTYTAKVRVERDVANPAEATATVIVTAAPKPTISFSPSNFSFSATQGGANPSNQTLEIWNSGPAGTTLNWSVSDNATWLSLSPTSGSSTGEHDLVTLSVNISEMSAGTYTATITISDPSATNNPQIVSVTLNVGDFTISASSTTLTAPPTSGASDPYTSLVITSLYSFSSPVSLFVQWCTGTSDTTCSQTQPASITPYFSVNPVTPPANNTIGSILYLDTNSTPVGNYYLRVKGSSGSLNRYTSVITLTVQAENCCNATDDDGDGEENGYDTDCQMGVSLSAGSNTICWWTEWDDYGNSRDYYSGWYTCPTNYIVTSVNITQYTEEGYDYFYIYDSGNTERYKDSGEDGSKTVDLTSYNTQKVKFRFTSDSGVVKDGVKVNTITCSAACSGTVALSLPSSATPSQTVTATVSGLSGCNGKTAYIKETSCSGTQKCTCSVSGSGCSCNFTAPSSAGTYTYYACVDKNADGDFADTGESALATLTVQAAVFDFSISVNPTSGSVAQGSSISATVSTTLISGAAQSVSFYTSGLPSGASASFSPPSCNPTCSSTMTINTSTSTPTGTYQIIVCGTNPDGTIVRCYSYYQLTVIAVGVTINPPQVTTNAATNITSTSATLNGTLNSLGGAASCLVWFEWGPTTSYGNSTPVQTLTSTGAFLANISGLASNTTYYFEAKAKNGGSW